MEPPGCGARIPQKHDLRAGPSDGLWRCHLHGRLSTGARTTEGLERIWKAQTSRMSSLLPLQLLDYRFHEPSMARHLHPPRLDRLIDSGQHFGRHAQDDRRRFTDHWRRRRGNGAGDTAPLVDQRFDINCGCCRDKRWLRPSSDRHGLCFSRLH